MSELTYEQKVMIVIRHIAKIGYLQGGKLDDEQLIGYAVKLEGLYKEMEKEFQKTVN